MASATPSQHAGWGHAVPLAAAAAGCAFGVVLGRLGRLGRRDRPRRAIGYVMPSADLPLRLPLPVFRVR